MNEITSSTQIDAPIDVVWSAITTPSQIKRWFFGVDTDSDWTVGSQLVHRASTRASPMSTRARSSRSSRPSASCTALERRLRQARRPRALPGRHMAARRDGWRHRADDQGAEPAVEDAAATSEQAWKGALGSLKAYSSNSPAALSRRPNGPVIRAERGQPVGGRDDVVRTGDGARDRCERVRGPSRHRSCSPASPSGSAAGR